MSTNDNQIIKAEPQLNRFWEDWYVWKPTNNSKLQNAEAKILSSCRSKIDLFFVSIGKKTYIRTLKAVNANSDESNATPIVLVHGMGAGSGLWCKNIDSLAAHRTVYAFDVLGFARSSRPSFPKEATEVENFHTESIEKWRQEMKLDKFILLGHSMGAYLVYAYSIRYPERVKYLILADPWGFSRYDEEVVHSAKKRWFVWLLYLMVRNQSPLSPLRISGPLGPYLIRKVRPDLAYYFYNDDENQNTTENEYEDYLGVYDYLYHCNAQYPSGETAFKTLSREFGWARFPMVDRIEELDSKIPITFLYGKESWMDALSAKEFIAKRNSSYVDVKMIPDCGHHVYAEGAACFNLYVNEVCQLVDKNNLANDGSNTEYKTEKPVVDYNDLKQIPRTNRPIKRKHSK